MPFWLHTPLAVIAVEAKSIALLPFWVLKEEVAWLCTGWYLFQNGWKGNTTVKFYLATHFSLVFEWKSKIAKKNPNTTTKASANKCNKSCLLCGSSFKQCVEWRFYVNKVAKWVGHITWSGRRIDDMAVESVLWNTMKLINYLTLKWDVLWIKNSDLIV